MVSNFQVQNLKYSLDPEINSQFRYMIFLKFVFSKKASKFNKIFTIDLTLTTYFQIDGEDFFSFVSFIETMNFTFVSCIVTS